MRISRLFVDTALQVGSHLTLDDNASHYLRSVLRLQAGQSLVLFNGKGGEVLANLLEVSRKAVRVELLQFVDRSVESPFKVQLGLGISRGDRMDWAVQKAVELGVAEITPLITERCVIKFNDDKKQQRQQHWLHIVQHAAEQSGRTVPPSLSSVSSIDLWLQQQQGLRIFLDPYAEHNLQALTPIDRRVTLLSGPEGGFSDAERQRARAAGFIPVRMGPRILRTETAVLAALTAVQTLWGDFGNFGGEL